MKTRTKTLIVVEITIVLCSVLLVALPAIAADQTEEPLAIYGNANEDDTIDMRDTTYIKLVIFGKKPKIDLADANNDGKVSMLDVGQTKLIILGKEKKLTVIDTADRVVTVDKPVKTIVVFYHSGLGVIKPLRAEDKVIAVDETISKRFPSLYPGFGKLPSIGDRYSPDYEMVFELKPDLVVDHSSRVPGHAEKLTPAGITIVGFDFYYPSWFTEEVRVLGYIIDRKDEAKEFIDWYEGYLNEIEEQTAELSEDEKPRVYFEAGYPTGYSARGKDSQSNWICIQAGGINIANNKPGNIIDVDPEWVVEQNPSIIIKDFWELCGYDYEMGESSELELKAIRESIINRPELANVEAVEEGDVVYLISFDVMSPAYFLGIPYMAKLFHPKLFEDLDPQAIHQEYMDKFQRIDFNVYEQGIFLYPIPEEW